MPRLRTTRVIRWMRSTRRILSWICRWARLAISLRLWVQKTSIQAASKDDWREFSTNSPNRCTSTVRVSAFWRLWSRTFLTCSSYAQKISARSTPPLRSANRSKKWWELSASRRTIMRSNLRKIMSLWSHKQKFASMSDGSSKFYSIWSQMRWSLRRWMELSRSKWGSSRLTKTKRGFYRIRCASSKIRATFWRSVYLTLGSASERKTCLNCSKWTDFSRKRRK